MACTLARPLVVAAVMDGSELAPRVAAHRAECLRCQAAEVRARALGRSLRSLEAAPVGSIGLADRLEPRLATSEPTETDQTPVRGLALSVAVAVAVVLVALRKARRRPR